VYGIALLTIAVLHHRSRFAVLLLAAVVPITSLFGLFTNTKSAVLIPWAMVVLAVILVRRRIAARWILLGVLATTFVYPINQFVRQDLLRDGTLSTGLLLRNPIGTLGRIAGFVTGSQSADYLVEGMNAAIGRMDCIGASSVLIRDTPRAAPFLHGETIGLFFVAFVPRVIWPDKPTITIGRYITNAYGSGPDVASDTAPSLLGEFFINFGYPGIIGGMLFYGILLRLLHELLARGRPTTPALFASVVVMLHLALGFQGGIANNWAITASTIVPIIVAHLFVRTLFPSRPLPVGAFEVGTGSPATER
jgi:hypothetical protein